MDVILNDFLKLKLSLTELKEIMGNDLYNITVKKPINVRAKDVAFLIGQYLSEEISLQKMMDWVNIIWFTDLYEYNLAEEESIASVMTLLETLDEDDAAFSNDEFLNMVKCLENNKIYDVL